MGRGDGAQVAARAQSSRRGLALSPIQETQMNLPRTFSVLAITAALMAGCNYPRNTSDTSAAASTTRNQTVTQSAMANDKAVTPAPATSAPPPSYSPPPATASAPTYDTSANRTTMASSERPPRADRN
jgi:hypothetical protein